MKKLVLITAAAMLLPLCAGLHSPRCAARADTLTLTTVADSTVDALNPTMAEGTGSLRGELKGTVDQPAEALTIFYMQFQMPDGITGQDIDSINSIDLKLRRAPGTATLSLTYYVYGVFEGFDSQDVNNTTWNDGVGFDPTHTLVKFLNPDNEEIFYYSDPAQSGFVGFIDTASEGPPQRPFGFFTIQADFATQNLHSLVLDDTDGKLTFYAKVRQAFEVTPLQKIASLEDDPLLAPQLIIDFNPASNVLDGDYNQDNRVDGDDFAAWEATFGDGGAGLAADGNANGHIDGGDFLIWQRNAGAASSPGLAAIPEPATASLAGVGLAIAFCALAARGKKRV